MATVAAKAARRAEVRQRLDQQVGELAARLQIEVPAEAVGVRDPELVSIIGLERQADILASINVALEENGIEIKESVPDEVQARELKALTRDELNVLAIELGIEAPEKFSNKAAVISAIEASDYFDDSELENTVGDLGDSNVNPDVKVEGE